MREYLGFILEVEAWFIGAKIISMMTSLFSMSWITAFLPLEFYVLSIVGLFLFFRHIAKKNEMAKDDFKAWLKDLFDSLRFG